MGGALTQMVAFSATEIIGGSGFGALVSNSADVSSGSTVTWNTESYDTSYWHSLSTNADRFTVGGTISYIRLTAVAIFDNAAPAGEFAKNAASFAGNANLYSVTANDDYDSINSAFVAVSSGDYFTLSRSMTIKANSCFGIEVISSATKNALVQKTATQSFGAAGAAITWNSEVRDTDSFHDNATNNTRLTVPSGVSLVRVSAGLKDDIASANTARQTYIQLAKSSASPTWDFPGNFVRSTIDLATAGYVNGVSGILAVSSSEYFELMAFGTTTRNAVNGDHTWFQIEEVPSGRAYCLAYKSASQSVTGGVDTLLLWGAEAADTHGFHSTASNTGNFTVPSGQGFTKARISFGLVGATTSELIVEARKNGTRINGMPMQQRTGAGVQFLNAMGAWVDCTDGDVFTLNCNQATTQTLPAHSNSWFCIECQ